MDSGPSVSGSGYLPDHHYGAVSADAEVLDRTIRANRLHGQAAFFSLVTRLDVPIFSRSANLSAGEDHVFVGAGRSYGVTQAIISLATHERSTIDDTKKDFRNAENSLPSRRYVAKRIIALPSNITNDTQQLAAITNEVRILANETLRNVDNLVQLLFVAWDEMPTQGRYWPRLLIEAADYGNLAEFLATSESTLNGDIKLELVLDVICGLQMLHNHKVAHCDLKLENVLVFRSDNSPKKEHGVKYRAKLCDFGFSVITSDYENGAKFSAKLGTEPWNAPELTFGTEIKIEDLHKADTYSFALLFSRVFMHGASPFEGLSLEEIRDLKRPDPRPESDLAMYERIQPAIFSRFNYSDAQQAAISKILLTTLGYKPEHRFPLHLVALNLKSLGRLFRDPIDTTSGDQNGGESAVEEKEDNQLNGVPPVPSTITSRVFYPIRGKISILMAPLRLIRQLFSTALIWLFIRILKRLGLIKNAWEDSLKLKVIYCKPIERVTALLPPSSIIGSDREEKEDISGIPDFEFPNNYNPCELSETLTKELLRDLLEQACDTSQPASSRAAEVTYQLAIAHFEGIGRTKDIAMGLEWLEKAALRGSSKALVGFANMLTSIGHAMTPKLEEAIRTRLPKIAQRELLQALERSNSNTISQYDECIALRQWATLSPDSYKDYIMSSEFSVIKLKLLSISITEGGHTAKETFSFKELEGHDPYNYEMFKPLNKEKFINSVRSHKCIEKTDVGCLTLLQVAATRGDLELVKTLIVHLGAKVDAVGATPGLTPLWISCLNGNIDVSSFLVAHGANPLCKDKSERTILHLLNKCRNTDDIATLLRIGLEAGIDIDERDSYGNTPLLSTFIGWDYSQGYAARSLLYLKADVLVESKRLWTPLIAAIRSLDLDLIKELSGYLERSLLQNASSLRIPNQSIEVAKAMAFNSFSMQNEFQRMRLRGASAPEKLQGIVDLLLDPAMLAIYPTLEASKGTNPLIGACYMRHDDLVKAVLSSRHCPNLADVDKNGMTALHWAAEHGRTAPLFELFNHGANPLIPDDEGLTTFHRSARFCPGILVQIFDRIEAGQISRPANLSVQSILNLTTKLNETVWMVAAIEGTSEHLKAVEVLRTRYDIDFDTFFLSKLHTDIKMTFMAYMIGSMVMSNLFTFKQIEYLLNLDPRPKFIADTTGATLLHYAVGGWQHASMGSNPTGYAFLKLLLRTFPGRKYVDMTDNRGYSPLHFAVYYSNVTAIEIIRDHLISIGEEMNPNMPNNEGTMPLAFLGKLQNHVKLDGEEHRSLLEILRRNTIRTHVCMRQLGAYFEFEQEGILVSAYARTQDELSKGRLLRFLEMMRRSLDVPWEFIEADIESAAEGTEEASFIVELCWCFDRFVLRATPIMTCSLSDHINGRYAYRLNVTQRGTSCPWLEIEREEIVLDQKVNWSRPGRLWTIDERRMLSHGLEMGWTAMFPEGSEIIVVEE